MGGSRVGTMPPAVFDLVECSGAPIDFGDLAGILRGFVRDPSLCVTLFSRPVAGMTYPVFL
jgi:hypothetical protein